ncbi:MAG: hypothetical protein NXH73_11420 [Flavobacteriaceae bacterium]|nr:hypothetical protein [Flavobacteriaceae bacterium]
MNIGVGLLKLKYIDKALFFSPQRMKFLGSRYNFSHCSLRSQSPKSLDLTNLVMSSVFHWSDNGSEKCIETNHQ